MPVFASDAHRFVHIIAHNSKQRSCAKWISTQPSVLAGAPFSVKEFRAAYGLSRSTVYALIRSGKLPNVRIGAKRIIPIDAAEALLRPEGAK